MRAAIAGLLALVLLLGIAVGLSQFVATAQISEQEAFQLFQQLGCTSCHNNAVAPDWNSVLEMLQKVQSEYGGDIDAFARDVNYFGRVGAFNSWQELMAVMAQNVGKSLDDPDIQKLNEFFLAYAGVQPGAGEQPAEQPQETQTEAPAETQQPAEQPPAQEQPAGQPKEEAKGIPFGLAVAIALIITLVIVGAAYFFTRK